MRKAFTLVEIVTTLTLITILSLAGIAGFTTIRTKAADEAAKANLTRVTNAQWAYVTATGTWATKEEDLELVAPTRTTDGPSENADTVSMLVQDGDLRIAVLSDTGTCFAQHWTDPAAGLSHTDSTIEGSCSAAGVA